MPQDDPDPPRQHFQLKPREFEALNQQPSPPSAAEPAPDPGVAAGPSQPIDVKEMFRQAHARDPQLLTREHHHAETEIHGVLRENLARENAAGINDVKSRPKRRSSRKRDYWTLMILGNAGFVVMALGSGPRNPIIFVYAIAGIGALSAGLTWIMWYVMDDY